MNENDSYGKKLSYRAIIAFLLSLFTCALIVAFTAISRQDIEELTMERILLEKSSKVNEVFSRLLYKTQTLSIFAQRDYTAEEFERIAATLTDDPAILNMLIAPAGIVKDVYPLKGNESVLGFDFFGVSAGNEEAVLAKETGQLVLGGPFEAVQGVRVIVGRLPVFTEQGGNNEFWGLVSVTLKYQDALDAAGLNDMRMQGLDYEVWRINPDDGKKQTIAGNCLDAREAHYIEKNLLIQNAEWVFRIYPKRLWYEYPDIWVMFLIGLCISALIAAVMQNNYDLRRLKENFETMSHTDPLTGIYNRRYFMECALTHLERSERLNASSAVIMMDVDRFKRVNDRLGHMGGDKVLQDFVAIVKGVLRPHDLFGRYGGEEFIVLVSDISEIDVYCLAERMRAGIADSLIKYKDLEIPLTASFGIAGTTGKGSLADTIGHADLALYAAKHSGRNRVELYEPFPEQANT